MILTLESSARLNNGVEIPYLGLGVYQSPPGNITQRIVKYALKIYLKKLPIEEMQVQQSTV
jgi:hypothetical protein